MKRLVIDDVRIFTFDADYCRSTDEFRQMYTNMPLSTHYDECWLDNDMGGAPGGDVSYLANAIEYLAATGYFFPIDTFVIHTANPVEGRKMYQALHKWYNVRTEDASKYIDYDAMDEAMESR